MESTLWKYLPLIVPLLLMQLALMAAALFDLSRRQQTKGPKWMWVIIIVLGELVGPVVYFLIGRVDE
jgi:hypothetical protein